MIESFDLDDMMFCDFLPVAFWSLSFMKGFAYAVYHLSHKGQLKQWTIHLDHLFPNFTLECPLNSVGEAL